MSNTTNQGLTEAELEQQLAIKQKNMTRDSLRQSDDLQSTSKARKSQIDSKTPSKQSQGRGNQIATSGNLKKSKRVTFSNKLVTIHEVESYKKYNAMASSEGGGFCASCSLI